MSWKLHQLIIFHETQYNDVNDNDEHTNYINNSDTKKTVMSETIIRSIIISITAIHVLTTSTTTVQETTMSVLLIKIIILIILSYVIIVNTVKVIISFKNMVNLHRLLSNLFNNITQIFSGGNWNTFISEQNNITIQLMITYVVNPINTWSLLAKFPIVHVRKTCFICHYCGYCIWNFIPAYCRYWLIHHLKSKIPGHIITYIYRKSKTFFMISQWT